MTKGRELRVMSFNILNAKSWLDMGRWRKRRDAVATCIRAFGPDLLGAQEVLNFQAEYLRRQLSEYQFVGAGRGDGVLAGECVAIFFRSDRFEKLDEGHFWLSRTPDVPGSTDWVSVFPRMASWVKLADRARPQEPLFLFNTHFHPFSPRARRRSARILRERIAGIAGSSPAVVTGDFNANAGRRTHAAVLAGRGAEGLELIDAYRSANPGRAKYEGTFRVPRPKRARRRIDWILHTPHFTTVAAAIDRKKRNGRYPSDHFPVVAALRWQTRESARTDRSREERTVA